MASIESFNGRMRDELLNETLFFDLDDVRAKIANWVADYNIRRPHSSLKYLTPAAYVAYLTATEDRLRNPDQLEAHWKTASSLVQGWGAERFIPGCPL